MPLSLFELPVGIEMSKPVLIKRVLNHKFKLRLKLRSFSSNSGSQLR